MRLRPFTFLFLTAVLIASFFVVPAPRSAASVPVVQSGQQDQSQGIHVGVSLVSLYATVRDNKKKIITDLGQNDFRIFEDGVEQKVAFFARESTLPLTLGMLIDTSGSEESKIGAEQQAATQFLQRVLQKKDEAMLMSFDLDVNLLSDWTNNLAELEHAIRRTVVNTGGAGGQIAVGPVPTAAGGGTLFYDAVYLACHDKMGDEAGRKALVILTDAQDEGSKMKEDQAIEAAQRADTVIHLLLVADRAFGGGNVGVARRMTDETGGRLIDVHNDKDLLQGFDQISEELRSEYSLGYYPTNSKLDGSYRKLRVETKNKDYKVLTRKGYYAQPSGN